MPSSEGDVATFSVFFRVDGGRSIGMGHVVRCLSLAGVLRNMHGCQVAFCMNQDEVGISRVQTLGWPVLPVGLGDFGNEARGDALVVDLAGGVPAEIVLSLREKHPRTLIVLMDGACTGRLEADLVVSPLERLPEAASWVGFRGQRYEGPSYAILDPVFAHVPRRSTTANNVRRVLVTMGGSDPHQLTLQALRALDEMPDVFETTVALGPAFLHDSALRSWLATARRQYEIRREDCLRDLMVASDLAVVSFGTTVYEMAAVGLPAVALAISEDHAQAAEIFARDGTLVTLGLFSSLTAKKLQGAVRELINDSARRLSMAQWGQDLVDGRGAERVAELLLLRIQNQQSVQPEDSIGTPQRA
jgi:spore coat polysaccharide biosynthesis protein SpsF